MIRSLRLCVNREYQYDACALTMPVRLQSDIWGWRIVVGGWLLTQWQATLQFLTTSSLCSGSRGERSDPISSFMDNQGRLDGLLAPVAAQFFRGTQIDSAT